MLISVVTVIWTNTALADEKKCLNLRRSASSIINYCAKREMEGTKSISRRTKIVQMCCKKPRPRFQGQIQAIRSKNLIAPCFAVLGQELRALHAAINGHVFSIAELKSTWENLDVTDKQWTGVCASYKSLLASAARNFEDL